MPKFTLLFTGLVLHVAMEDGSRSAFLVNDHHHVPKLLIPISVNVVEGPGWKGKLGKDYREYDLRGRRIQIEHVDKSAVIVDPSFRDNVPRLQAILEGSFNPAEDELLDEAQKSREVATFVEYSGGTLSVLNCFAKSASFVPPIAGDPRCIGRTILFAGSTTTGSQITIKDGLGNSLIVPDETEIGISNTAPGSGSHHLAYGRLLKSKKKPREMVEAGDCTTCSSKEEGVAALRSSRAEQRLEVSTFWSLSIECSNSQWP